jgi:N-acetylmuramoyl-L-alanine amidase
MFSIFCLFLFLTTSLIGKLVMINPGDGKGTGRMIVDGYERGVTLSMAEELQKKLSERYGVRVVLSRSPGEEVSELSSASFANRMNTDFFISLHVYHQEEPKPNIYLYNLVYNPLVDVASHQFVPLTFVPLYQAHFVNSFQTRLYGSKIKDVLEETHNKKVLDVHGMFGIPFRPLCGILAPALAIEVGLSYENQWKNIMPALVDSMNFLASY